MIVFRTGENTISQNANSIHKHRYTSIATQAVLKVNGGNAVTTLASSHVNMFTHKSTVEVNQNVVTLRVYH